MSTNFTLASKVVGGLEVNPPFKYDFMVAILKFELFRCGGVLYNSNTVITAGHCTTGRKIDHHIVVHRHNFEVEEKDEKAKRFRVKSRLKHPEFEPATYKNDLAIWKIRGWIPIKRRLLLYHEESLPKMLVVIGWGATAENEPKSSKLLEFQLPPYDMDECIRNYQKIRVQLFPKGQLCAGFPEGGKDACQGDSGGPLFIPAKGKLNPILVGIVSWGNTCAAYDQPGVYTRISNYIHWITNSSA